jgi:hypothetical protein
MTKYQAEIMEILKSKDAYILAYQSRLDVRCVLIFSQKEFPLRDKVIRFDTFANMVRDGLLEQFSKKDPYNYWVGKWRKK